MPWLTIITKNNKAVYVKAGSTLKETLKALGKAQDYISVYFEATDKQYKEYLGKNRRD